MSEVKQKVERTVVGTVSSDKMDKTITVLVERLVKHPIYGKYIKRSTKFHAHDENNICKVGDVVEIKQSRPMSKLKSWELVKVIEEARG
ncbi:30S ribosomal protein S17 [Wohlfahrtiimonas chitiniclastica]|uniref:Small ribosomal subunit protein uS17 n=2 Tax=Wohlfahrtiimonas chitiniclastica TaxID=400946 RepID=L8XZ43_9GAMM|nr:MULTISPECIES: 30S ribosomal protein S17 [Wohlfahrtiimonas]ELV08094.1 30S ribosomal protein S17 [Wohlfahrtiimonas chitiniclastica SH04]KZS23724.1 30S ribosomal protein S17 [Wohlfahrtiimonas chitiniclastica]KZX36501.1 30S ribosomal protein S17 [Wohlfahrtiimonas chitiniclastica]MBS7814397.1 30S ribosomal protein S17 [Wohlfahrtiimonas chitiniclastica]MBS7816418.1 30S ribosomal protein S17 [Wohlfahrtiimonas chitiniclastica]